MLIEPKVNDIFETCKQKSNKKNAKYQYVLAQYLQQ